MLDSATSVYIPDGESIETENAAVSVVTCPSGCICAYDNNTAECTFGFSDYSFQKVLPWQLTKLSIHGNDKTWKSEFASNSVTNVIQTDVVLKKNSKDAIKTSLSKLTYLDISYIPIHAISNSDFEYLPSLKFLKLAYNNISSIQKKAFENLLHLETLNLDGNKLSKLEDNLFKNLNSLKSLQLGSNSLTKIGKNKFTGLEHLKYLNLQSNMMYQMETFIPFLNVSELESLNVRGNQIRYVLDETVDNMLALQTVDISNNPLECTCVIERLVNVLKERPTLFEGGITCGGPSELIGVSLSELDVDSLPCESATVAAVSADVDVLYQVDLVLDCEVEGSQPLVLYWQTPWGENFTRHMSKLLFPDSFKDIKTDNSYYEINLFLTTRVFVSNNGSLVIEKFRGHFAGKFTCFGLNLIGSSNSSVYVGIRTTLDETYISSLIIGAIASSCMLLVAAFIGLTRLFMNKCLNMKCFCCDEEDPRLKVLKKVENSNGDVEVTYAASDNINTIEYIDCESCQSPPGPPVNSPMFRMSPEKCRTPDEEPADPTKGLSYQHIWEQLDEVRTRLRYGAGRKIKKVRSHVRSITDTGIAKVIVIQNKLCYVIFSSPGLC